MATPSNEIGALESESCSSVLALSLKTTKNMDLFIADNPTTQNVKKAQGTTAPTHSSSQSRRKVSKSQIQSLEELFCARWINHTLDAEEYGTHPETSFPSCRRVQDLHQDLTRYVVERNIHMADPEVESRNEMSFDVCLEFETLHHPTLQCACLFLLLAFLFPLSSNQWRSPLRCRVRVARPPKGNPSS